MYPLLIFNSCQHSAALISSSYFFLTLILREKEFKANLRRYMISPLNTLICIFNTYPLFLQCKIMSL